MWGRSRPWWFRQTVALVLTAMVTVCACEPISSAEPGPQMAASRLDAAITATMTDMSIPGAVVGVWDPTGDYVRSLGVADKATEAPMQTDFYSRIGSVTKTFTVTALLQLVDQGKLNLDDPISKLVPGVPSGDQITCASWPRCEAG